MHVAEVDHCVYIVPGMDKDRALVRILEVENPPAALIFCNRREEVHYYAVVLQRFGYDADELSSDLTQRAREEVMGRLRKGTLRFLVATDVAGRGIDIPDLSHVFQIGVSDDPEGYIHRAGRTGRAGAAGVAISIVDVLERGKLEQIAEQFKISFNEKATPSDEDVATVVGQRLTAMLESRLRALTRIEKERLQRFAPLAKMLCESEDETDLIAMLLDSIYHESLHGGPDEPAEADPLLPAQTSPPPASSRPSGESHGHRGGGGRTGPPRRRR